MSAIILRDDIVHYEVLGRGRPLIFLHSWVGSWRYWIPTMQAASVSFRTYAIDLWGFGDTAKNTDYYGIDRQVDLLERFLQEMGIAKIALIGHGLGAIVALLYAARAAAEAAAASQPASSPYGAASVPGAALVDRLMAISLPVDINQLSPRLRSASPAELADWLLGKDPVAEAARIEAPKADPQAIRITLEDLQTLNLPALPTTLTTPCLLVHGQNDQAVQEPSAERVVSFPENVHVISFENSSHFPMLDETSKFNRLMADFLALSSGASPRQLQLKEEWKRRIR